jgi:hypothetical protein
MPRMPPASRSAGEQVDGLAGHVLDSPAVSAPSEIVSKSA